jgi:hypothetical protein
MIIPYNIPQLKIVNMKKIPLLLCLTFASCGALFAQTKFQKGYFIDNNNNRTECLIKNVDGINNPTKFSYKISEYAETKSAEMPAVKKFGIYEVLKFIRADVNIDLTDNGYNLSVLNYNKDPEWQQKQLFLKVLVEGKASLYYYETQGIKRFFYATHANDSIRELIYKDYFDSTSDSQLKTNTAYRKQLSQDVLCNYADVNTLQNLEYKINPMEAYFKHYNECVNSSFVQYDKKKNNGHFNFGIFAGADAAAMRVNNDYANIYFTFSRKISPAFGVYIGYTFPWNNNKWQVLLEPTFHSFNQTGNAFSSTGNPISVNNVSANYSVIDFPLGLRYYMFLNDDSKFFVSAFANSSASLKFKKMLVPLYNLPAHPLGVTPAIGIGYNYNRFSFEGRYYFNQNLISVFDNANWNTRYNRLSLMLGYRIW